MRFTGIPRVPILLLTALLISLGGLTATAAAVVQPAESATGMQYQNPLGPRIPDPFIFRASNGMYYAYGTTGFQAWSSPDLVHWQTLGVVFPASARLWGTKDFWAPEVVEYQGRFYMYYSAERALGGKRIGVAVADQPTGPFRDLTRQPLFDPGFATIDAHVFIDDDGKKYLYFAQDQEPYGLRRESRIYVIELGDDMASVKGSPVLCTKPDQPWEMMSGPNRLWNEGPTMVKHGSTYYLMYSANLYNTRNYAIGYATSSSPLGPFTKYAQNPVVRAEWSSVSGPGHHSVVKSPDGKELFIAYHTHVDPAAGQGARQMNIDRMGFRADGSIYVNGPTLTPQPLPSGEYNQQNIAPNAVVTASSVQNGFQAEALIDGEIGLYSRFAQYEWSAAGEGEGAWVQLNWDKPQRAGLIYIYGSAEPSRRLRTGTLMFSNGAVLHDIQLPDTPGAAAIVHAPPADITWVRFVAGPTLNQGGSAGLSEIMVFSNPPDSVWLASPQQGALLHGAVPIEIAAPQTKPANVRLDLDEHNLYSGADLPQGLRLQAAGLAAGRHVLRLSVADQVGKVQTDTAEFTVEHVWWRQPAMDWGTTLQGSVVLEPATGMDAGEITSTRMCLLPVSADNQVHEVMQAQQLPDRVTLDTKAIPDGAYDLELSLTTSAGVTSHIVNRVMIKNWHVVEDELLPPLSGWFAAERLLAAEHSAGWEYTSGELERFLGDADRLRRSTDAEEYLIWETPQLASYEFIVYAQQADVQQMAAIAVQQKDGVWRQLPYTVQVTGESDTGWLRLSLRGTVPDDLAVQAVRFSLLAGAQTEQPELGRVRLQMAADPVKR